MAELKKGSKLKYATEEQNKQRSSMPVHHPFQLDKIFQKREIKELGLNHNGVNACMKLPVGLIFSPVFVKALVQPYPGLRELSLRV